MIERLKTGFPALDEALNGGIPRKNSVLVTGKAGTGKTIFCMQALYNMIKQGEKGLYLSLEQNPEDVLEQCEEFDWKLKELIDDGRLVINHHAELDYTSLEISLENMLRGQKVTVVVLDPISMLQMYFKDKLDFRVALFNLFQMIKKYKATALLIDDSEAAELDAYAADGLIEIKLVPKGPGTERTLEILKMEKTAHSTKLILFIISKKGIIFQHHG